MAATIRDDVRIPLRDGLTLAATLVLPDGVGSQASPIPAVFNMDPYRKDDWGAGWARSLGTFLADHGFAYCRADVRGTGSSDGVALDEYTEAETLDGYDAVEWLAAQPWCNGRVGMWGLSYGGFTSIQVAALRPPHLRAIVPIQATDDRYTDDVHYVGGAMTVSELSQYAVSQVAMNALPATPETWGPTWKARWLERLEATPPWLLPWARDQRDGPRWRRGSLAPDYGRIEAAILQFGGWMDEYVDAALRIQARCANAAGRRTVIGPWVHGLPDHATPEPNVDWLGELLRWFGCWLRDEPAPADQAGLVWFQRDPTPPERFPAALRGTWRSVPSWRPDAVTSLNLVLAPGAEPGLGTLAGDGAQPQPATAHLANQPTAGVHGGSLCWGAGHPPNGLAADLRLEEPGSLLYTTRALEDPVEILGAPVAVVLVASERPVAQLVARLADVAPDGAVEQVCEGLLNLTHRDSHSEPEPLEAGRVYEVRLALRSAAYRFPAGHRIRLMLATAHWPVAWPSPGVGDLSIHLGGPNPSRLALPLAPADAVRATDRLLTDAPPVLPEFDTEVSDPATWEIVEDPADGAVTVRTYEASMTTLLDRSTLFVSEALSMTASVQEPGAGHAENTCEYRLTRDGVEIAVIADGVTTATADTIEMAGSLRVRLDGEPFYERAWREPIPRDLL